MRVIQNQIIKEVHSDFKWRWVYMKQAVVLLNVLLDSYEVKILFKSIRYEVTV